MPEELPVINHPGEIPAFATEAEEAEFWDTHSLADHLLSRENADGDLLPLPRLRISNPTSIRIGTDLERRLRHLAELKGISYQTLLKEFVLERVYEEEKRLGVI